jgi:flagellar basal-body rod protein FlgC
MINAMNIAVSGLITSGLKMAVTANNIANANTTGQIEPAEPADAPYAAQSVKSESVPGGAVKGQVVQRDPPFVPAFDPNSPFADEQGIIGAPNVSLDQELVHLKVAENNYNANAQTLSVTKELQETLLQALNEEV